MATEAPGLRDWDAATYDRVSDPMLELGRKVLARLELCGQETVLDAGCGSGRVTELLAKRLPRGRVIAVDASPSMVAVARGRLRPVDEVLAADLLELELPESVDAILSTATFHWILDHRRLFSRLAGALSAGGRLEAQCGGEGNVERVHRQATAVAGQEPFAGFFSSWRGPWRFAGVAETEQLLRAAGFAEIRCWLASHPVTPPEPLAYLASICLGTHLQRLPAPLRRPFAERVLARLGDSPELDYVRLNISARRDVA